MDNKLPNHGYNPIRAVAPASKDSMIVLRDLLISYGYSSAPAAIDSAIEAIQKEKEERIANGNQIYDALIVTFDAQDVPNREKVDTLIELAELACAGKTLDDFVWRREIEEQARDYDDLLATQRDALGTL